MWICRYLGSFEAPLLYQGMLEIVAMTTRIIHFRCKFIFWRATLILVEKCMLLEKLVLYLVSGIHNAIISFQELKRREDAIARGLSIFWYVLERDYDTEVQSVISLFFLAAGVVIEEKNWPPFFPIIHHDIANEIPIHLQRIQYVAFTTYLGMLIFIYFLLW